MSMSAVSMIMGAADFDETSDYAKAVLVVKMR